MTASKTRGLRCAFFLTTAILFGCGGSNENRADATSKFLAAAITSTSSTSSNASFSEPRGNYSITKTSSGVTVTDRVGNDGVVNLAASVKTITFSDLTVSLDIAERTAGIAAGDLNTLIELYVAFFNRVPDAEGLAYWVGEYQRGRSLESIANSFYDLGVQSSALTGYSASMSDADLIRLVYKNVLSRTTVNQSEIDYWLNGLTNRAQTRGSIVLAILRAAHSYKGDATYGWVADLLDSKISVSKIFAVQEGLSFKTAADAITKGMEIAASITPSGSSAAENKIHTIVQANIPPVADAGTAQAVYVGSTVTLNGTKSFDLDKDSLTYLWTLSKVPTGSTARLSSSTAAMPSFYADISGTYIASLVVSDGKDQSKAASVTITASTKPVTPIADTGLYKCSSISKATALSLYALGHTYLDRDHDGDPCEADDIAVEVASSGSTGTSTGTSGGVKQCWVNGYYRKNGTYVSGYWRSC